MQAGTTSGSTVVSPDPLLTQAQAEAGSTVSEVNAGREATASLPEPPTRIRLPQDVAVDTAAPDAKPFDRPIGNSPTQNARMQADRGYYKSLGADEFRVNQQQVNAAGERVGINRPDLQFTLNGVRYYIEYDLPSSMRGLQHLERLLANDPSGVVIPAVQP